MGALRLEIERFLEVLGRPVARYSDVVVFHVVKSHADAFIEKSAQFHTEPIERFWDALWLGIQV